MERGQPDLTVYTFAVPEGQRMKYPDAELWTLDFREADAYAAEHGYLLVGADLTMRDGVVEADYATSPDKDYATSPEGEAS
jgi:hypothetical protein